MPKKKTIPQIVLEETAEQPTPDEIKKAATEKAAIVAIYAKGQAETIFANLSDETLIKHYKMVQQCSDLPEQDDKFNQLLMVAKVDALTKIEHMLKGRGIDRSKHVTPESLVW